LSPPSRDNPGGRAYLALQRLAREQRRPTDELMRLYALEGFLGRLAVSPYAEDLVLKGGVLLAAYATRRPTRDIDLEGLRLPNDIDHLLSIVAGIANVPQDDGLIVNLDSLRAETIRDSDHDVYSGVRIHLQADLATARLAIGVDISVGDPIIPEPRVVALPRLLVAEPVRLKGYPMTMVLAEKIITAVQRGTANTRWRVCGHLPADRTTRRRRAGACSRLDRGGRIPGGADATSPRGAGGVRRSGAARWSTWRRKNDIEIPQEFAAVLARVIDFADPILSGEASGRQWRFSQLRWS
jgi:hypothetical protein